MWPTHLGRHRRAMRLSDRLARQYPIRCDGRSEAVPKRLRGTQAEERMDLILIIIILVLLFGGGFGYHRWGYGGGIGIGGILLIILIVYLFLGRGGLWFSDVAEMKHRV